MVTVYYTKITNFEPEELFQTYLGRVDPERRKKVLRIKSPQGKLRSLAAGSLLQFGVSRMLGKEPFDSAPFFFVRQKGGKPVWPGAEPIHFNLSHSGDYACCAVSPQPVGVDIQVYAGVRPALAERFYTKEDNRKLSGVCKEEQEALFYRLWSIKESYLKLTGEGIARGLSAFESCWDQPGKENPDENGGKILQKGKTAAYFQECRALCAYAMCVCSYENGPVKWQEICQW